METIKKEITIELEYGLDAKVSLMRASQQAPWQGDEVMVEARIDLPAERGKSTLNYHLRFGERLWLAGIPLEKEWGWEGEGCRWISKCFRSWKASEAFELAEKWAMEEVGKLAKMLEERRRVRES
jgi:hypothetical protein